MARWWTSPQETWFVAFDRSSDNDPQPKDTAVALEVTGEAAATPTAIAEAVPVNMKEFTFELPASIASGPQIWDMGNTGAQPHFMVLWGVPDGTTMTQVMGTITSFMTGTPTADALGFNDLRTFTDTSFISPGQHTWIQVNLDPGTYAAVCFFPDKETGQPHAMEGLITRLYRRVAPIREYFAVRHMHPEKLNTVPSWATLLRPLS